VNGFLSFVFIFVKDDRRKARIYTGVSKLLFDKNNSLEYDESLKGFWLKNKNSYLFFVKEPYFNFSKKNLYRSIDTIYCKHYTPSPGATIVDVGAGIGTETLYFHEKIGANGKIYSIEASPDSFKKLKGLCANNNIKNSFNHNIAISNFNGKIWMEEMDRFEVNQVNQSEKGIEIDCYTLDSFVEEQKIQIIDFLKVNIEGAELEMIKGMDRSIHKTRNVAISCHDFLFKEDKKIRSRVISFLEANKFKIRYNQTGNKVADSWIYASRQ
jgi:FkbM family methyltransferase